MTENSLYITPERLHARMASDRPVALVDVRSPAEYRAGHVRGAVSLPLDDLTPARLERRLGKAAVGAEQPLYLTCHSGLRAQQAAQQLYQAGYRNLVLLQGGTAAWERAGLPMRRRGHAIALERQVQITIGALLILKVVFGFAVHELFFVLGALLGAGLITAGLTRWCGMARLLARMPWNRDRRGSGAATA